MIISHLKNKTELFFLTENGKYLKEPCYSAFVILHPATTWSTFRFLRVNYRIWSIRLGSGFKAGQFALRAA